MTRILAVAALLALSLVWTGCATTHDGSGGTVWVGNGLPAGMDEAALEQATSAEASREVSQVQAVAAGVHEVGARLAFTFWAERGALTLVAYESSGRGGPIGRPVDVDATLSSLRTVFETYAMRRTGEVRLVLRRQESRWAVDYESGAHARRPPEAKSLPVRWEGTPTPAIESSTEELGRLLRAVEVPAGGAARVVAEARLEDGRVEGWELRSFQVTHRGVGGGARPVSEAVRGAGVKVLLPFMEGLGPRAVRVEWVLVHREGEARAGGWVEGARVVRASPPAGLDDDAVAEYRALHEDILRRWREGVHEGFSWLARRGVEELALWYVGGVLAKSAGFWAVRGGGIVLKALRRGKEAAAGWLRTMLARLSGGERRAFERLWAKVQLEGEKALSAGERQELRALMARIEQLAASPLTPDEKDIIRAKARRYYKALHPRLAPVMDSLPAQWPVHHRRPLQYAHLLPAEDINAASNLAMVEYPIHSRINMLWDKFSRARPAPSADDVRRAAGVIDDQFGPWYHRAGGVPTMKTPDEAEQAALEALKRLFPGLE
ncbi:hypothetical protein [Myxococcus sp. RHSTA-1-4]|uniref:hypothetical protein n=1 Tax=Myxococcus sp. RHSTA-1-4 TaxID=2874601 RepID=UPI001CBAB27B|nr:hypothetical protein [Myxococcus sp. RHSTA-1-4]MBZ4422179.1 hypothetical protein [Myxococcus sp. RHSTA-1-4]